LCLVSRATALEAMRAWPVSTFDVDLLVIEATFLDRDAATARNYGHLTAREAASLAAANNVGQLVLNHMSGRYRDEELLAEATMIFPNTRIAADFDRIVI